VKSERLAESNAVAQWGNMLQGEKVGKYRGGTAMALLRYLELGTAKMAG
jgi:hypothetical protein